MLGAAVAAHAQAQPARSGFEFMTPSTQALQRDDTLNPGMLWLEDGAQAWSTEAGAARRSCQGCHGDAGKAMRGVAPRYPAFDAPLQRPVTLSQRINQCRQRHQQAAPLAPESAMLLGLETYVAFQSRGLPLAPPDDPRLAPDRALGRQLYTQRIGQLDLSCAQCHDRNAGRRLGGSIIPEGHANGYPSYRLEWQGLGSLQRRVRNCMTGVRAEAFALDSRELTALELYLAVRAAGLAIETPAVRP